VRLQARLQVAPYCSHLSEYARRRNRQHDDAIGEQDGLSSARSLAASAASGETNGSSSTRRVGFDHKRAVARSRPPGRIGARSNVCLRGGPRDAPRQSRIGLLKARPTLVLLCHKFRYLFRPAQHGQRNSIVARATTSLRRIVAIEFGNWRSGRNGGSSGLVTLA
jgi:hypothetical protein